MEEQNKKTKNGARWVLRSVKGLVKVRLGWIIYYESKTFIYRDTLYELSPSVIFLSFSGFPSMWKKKKDAVQVRYLNNSVR